VFDLRKKLRVSSSSSSSSSRSSSSSVEYFSAFVILRNQIITHSLNGPIDSLSSAVHFGENRVKFGQEITKILACEKASDLASN